MIPVQEMARAIVVLDFVITENVIVLDMVLNVQEVDRAIVVLEVVLKEYAVLIGDMRVVTVIIIRNAVQV